MPRTVLRRVCSSCSPVLGALALLLIAMAGCSGEPTGEGKDDDAAVADVGANDTSVTIDSTVPDAAAGDAGVSDAPNAPPSWAHQCQQTADCAVFEDGNACNGTLFCSKASKPHRCVLKPSTIVTCPAAKDHACATNTCDPSTGKCAMKPTPKDTPCVDSDPCTPDSACNGTGTCVATSSATLCGCKKAKDCDPIAAKNLCLGSWYCDLSVFPWTCRPNPATAVKCSDKSDTTCATNACDPKTGKCAMKPEPDGTPCDDGSKATLNDICKKGVCESGVKAACKSNADCDKEEDGDACNGTLYCDKGSGLCKVNPATVIACKTNNDDECIKNTCDPDSGVCALKALKNGTSCDDGDKCTQNELCLQGKCTGGEDQCPCTDDKSCAPQDDGNVCNGTLFCNKKTKKCELNPASVKVCKTVDDTACKKNACAPKTGTCAMTPTERATLLPCPQTVGDAKKNCRWEVKPASAKSDEISCDDGDKCTATSACAKGECSGVNTLCVCKKTADCANQEDGNLCNGTLFCNPKGLCELNKATIKSCPKPAAGSCIGHACSPKSGKCLVQPLPTGTPCDDGEKCTKAEYCVLGECKGGVKACACINNADCAGKDDGDFCNGVFICDKTGAVPACKFAPGSAVVCPPASGPCLTNSCVKATGKCVTKLKGDGTKCDDDEPCSIGDTCAKGKCAGKANPCNDGNFCTLDTCLKGTGCQHSKNLCDDGNDCTADACDAKNGKCSFDAAGREAKGCNDGDGCSVGDICKKGSCVAGSPIVCNQPSGACTEPKCVSVAKGQNFSCVVVAKKDGATCDDGDACSLGSSCIKGACKAGDKLALWKSTAALVGKDPSSSLRAAAVTKGGYYVGGVAHDPVPGKLAKSTLWVARVHPEGKVDWHYPFDSPKPHASAGIAAVIPDAKGGVYALGTSYDTGLDGRFIHRSADNKTIFNKVLGEPGNKQDAIEDATANADGGLLTAGWQSLGSGAAQGWVQALSVQGAVGWKVAVGGAGDDRFHAVGLTAKGHVAAAGYENSTTKGVRKGWLAAITQTGAVSWQRGYGARTQQALTGVVGMKNGDLFAAGVARVGTKDQRWYLRVRSNGQPIWSTVRSGHFAVTSLRWLASDRVVVTGQTNPGTADADGWIAALDGSGNTTWERSYTNKHSGSLDDVLVLATGGLFAVGATGSVDSQGKRDLGLMLRIDGWGHATCSDSGGCIGKAAGFCDDGNPCTRDRCVAKGGKATCEHATVPGMNCATSDGCSFVGTCAGKTCEPGEAGRLFSTDYVHRPMDSVASVVAGINGGFEVTGMRGGAVATLGFDDLGQPVGERTFTVKSSLNRFHHIGGDIPTGDGAGVLLYALANYKNSFAAPSSAWLYRGGTNAYKHLWTSAVPPGLCKDKVSGTDKKLAKAWYDAFMPPPFVKSLSWSVDGKYVVMIGLAASDSHLCASAVGSYPARHMTKRCAFVRRVPVDFKTLQWTGTTICDGFTHDGNNGAGTVQHTFGQRTIDDVSGTPSADGGVILAGGERVVATGSKSIKAHPYYIVEGLQPLLIRITSSGNTAWRKSFVVSKTASFSRAVQTADAGILAAGSMESAQGIQKLLLVSTFANGNERWRKLHLVLGAPQVAGLSRLKGGDILIGGSVVEGSIRKPWTARIDALGNFLHKRIHDIGKATATPAASAALFTTADGGFVLAGQANAGSNRVFAVRGDAFGHGTCKSAGKCATKSAADCSDGDPCTLDHCDAKKGCVHPKLSCADNDPCTLDTCQKNGACKHTTNDCDDGDACTLDTCNEGVDALLGDGCEHTKNACDDGNLCTVDSCDKKTGCKSVAGLIGKRCWDAKCRVGTCGSGGICGTTATVMRGCNKNVPASSCKVIRSKYLQAPDGEYWLDWGAADPITKAKWGPRKFRCDMSGGGWTRVVNEDFETATGNWAKQVQCNASKVGCGARTQRFYTPIHFNIRFSASFLGKTGDSGCRHVSSKYLSNVVKLDYCPSSGANKDVCSKHMKTSAVVTKKQASGKHAGYSVVMDFNNGDSNDSDPLSFCYDDLEVWVL